MHKKVRLVANWMHIIILPVSCTYCIMAADFGRIATSEVCHNDSQRRVIRERGKDKTSVSLLTFKMIIYIRLNIIFHIH